MAGQLNITGLSASEMAGQRSFGPFSIQGTSTIGETLVVPLALGNNTFTVPSGSVAVLIVPPTSGSSELKVRTSLNPSDEGLEISPANPTVYSFPVSSPTSLTVHSSAATGAISLSFI